MSTLPRRRHPVYPVSLLIACLLLLLSSAATPARAQRATGRSSADLLLATYYNIVNAGMKSGNFSALDSVLTPDTKLITSSPVGKTEVYQGLRAVISWYHQSYLRIPGLYFKPFWVRDISPTILFTYDTAANPKHSVVGRCAHMFVIKNGKFSSHDYIVCYTGPQ